MQKISTYQSREFCLWNILWIDYLNESIYVNLSNMNLAVDYSVANLSTDSFTFLFKICEVIAQFR